MPMQASVRMGGRAPLQSEPEPKKVAMLPEQEIAAAFNAVRAFVGKLPATAIGAGARRELQDAENLAEHSLRDSNPNQPGREALTAQIPAAFPLMPEAERPTTAEGALRLLIAEAQRHVAEGADSHWGPHPDGEFQAALTKLSEVLVLTLPNNSEKLLCLREVCRIRDEADADRRLAFMQNNRHSGGGGPV